LHILNDIEEKKNWQPSDLLPSFATENDELTAARAQAKALPLSVLVVLIGDMITEEGLPTYMSQLNRVPGTRDESGVDQTPFAQWVRGWTAEENRHGDILNALLRLNENVHMRAVEQTTQYLLAEGFDPRTESKPYQTVFYTTFQEWATMHSHNNVARLAQASGDALCAKICRRIAGDEARHERFYGNLAYELLDEDPSGMLLAIKDMVDKDIVMPAERMKESRKVEEGSETRLFDRFARVAGRLGVYTPLDYVVHVKEVVETLDVASRVVTGEAAQAQEALCAYGDERTVRIATKLTERLARSKPEPFAWIYGREA
jgi:acyl-[acyl-carrier-protein] desaturase